jgi:hypothetical protein
MWGGRGDEVDGGNKSAFTRAKRGRCWGESWLRSVTILGCGAFGLVHEPCRRGNLHQHQLHLHPLECIHSTKVYMNCLLCPLLSLTAPSFLY